MKRLIIVGAVALISALAIIFGYWLPHRHHANFQSVPPIAKAAAAAPLKLDAGYLISGDVFWGRYIEVMSQQSSLKYDYPFSRLSEFHPEQYNGWISDMECPVDRTVIPYQVQVDSLVFACSPDYLTAAAKYFTAMTVANNHTDNTGRSGFLDTQTNLAAAGIQPFGDYDLSQTDDLCEIVSMPALVNGKAAKLPIAMCGYHWLARAPTDEELSQITKFAQYFPVWVFPHGGTEYAIHSTPQQEALYRKMIDLGASVVFGDHPHVVENTEAYHGKLIVYDLGNLIFDQWFDNEVTKSLIVKLKVSAAVDDNLQKYLNMGAACAAFKDNCLQTAINQGLKAYKLQYSYDIVAGDSSRDSTNDRLKHLASPAVQQWLLQRTDWATTSASLSSQPY